MFFSAHLTETAFQHMADNNGQQRVYTVSKLTADIKRLLEDRFPFIWITGEISNFRMPASKHYYFTLKDNNAQISGVMFRGQNRGLKFIPEDGMKITGLGRITVYEPRGNYQLIFEYMEPRGAGELQIAFEQLKQRLGAEGLFDQKHKKALPFLPQKISVITSPTGAVIHDIIRVTNRRFSSIHIEVVQVKVQGSGAELEIARSICLLNKRADTDIIIIARGGGSLEDLNAFNTEMVARAIYDSEIPVISAVGHETDFTIADFVADLRAPTPSAAAELAVPVKSELIRQCAALSSALELRFFSLIKQRRKMLTELSDRLIYPGKKIQDYRLKLDDLSGRLGRQMKAGIGQHRERLAWRTESLMANSPMIRVAVLHEKLGQLRHGLIRFFVAETEKKKFRLREVSARLNALNPSAILDRGYSITLTVPDETIVRDVSGISEGQELIVKVAGGIIHCRVEGTTANAGKTDF